MRQMLDTISQQGQSINQIGEVLQSNRGMIAKSIEFLNLYDQQISNFKANKIILIKNFDSRIKESHLVSYSDLRYFEASDNVIVLHKLDKAYRMGEINYAYDVRDVKYVLKDTTSLKKRFLNNIRDCIIKGLGIPELQDEIQVLREVSTAMVFYIMRNLKDKFPGSIENKKKLGQLARFVAMKQFDSEINQVLAYYLSQAENGSGV